MSLIKLNDLRFRGVYSAHHVITNKNKTKYTQFNKEG